MTVSNVVTLGSALHGVPGAECIPPHRRRQNTMKVMLADTAELLGLLSYADKNSRDAAHLQAEAISEILSNGEPLIS